MLGLWGELRKKRAKMQNAHFIGKLARALSASICATFYDPDVFLSRLFSQIVRIYLAFFLLSS